VPASPAARPDQGLGVGDAGPQRGGGRGGRERPCSGRHALGCVCCAHVPAETVRRLTAPCECCSGGEAEGNRADSPIGAWAGAFCDTRKQPGVARSKAWLATTDGEVAAHAVAEQEKLLREELAAVFEQQVY
jgi:hypothetical protein